MEERKKQPARKRHQLLLRNREEMVVDGVLNVESFDDKEVVLETEGGLLLIRGADLHIKELNLENATLLVKGIINALEYAGQKKDRAKGLLARVFR